MQTPKLANFRDLGGIAAAGGRTVLPGRLLRSGEVVALAQGDEGILVNEYHLRNIVDLRSEAERAKTPDDTLPGVAYYPIDVLKNAASQAPDRKHLLTMMDSPEAVDRFMKQVYVLLITEESARAGYRQLLDILLRQKEGATLWHCFAGKDRAGLAAAIVLTILGASREDVMADYLRTNTLRAAINQALLAQAKEKGSLSGAQLAAIRIALDVQAEYLETSYRTAEERYGSFEGYLTEGLGVDAAMQSELRGLYLSP